MPGSESLGRLKEAYTVGGRRVAASLMARLGKTWITPNVLSTAGVATCIAGSIIVYFEYHGWWLFLVGSAVLLGSILDILDGALARSQGLGTPFGAFVDSTVDRIGEAFMLGAIALTFMRDGRTWAVAMAFAAVAGSFLVSYTRAKAEIIGLRGDVGLGTRVERVAVICIGLALAPVGVLPWAVVLLTAAAWFTVGQRMLFVRRQLQGAGRRAADGETSREDPAREAGVSGAERRAAPQGGAAAAQQTADRPAAESQAAEPPSQLGAGREESGGEAGAPGAERRGEV